MMKLFWFADEAGHSWDVVHAESEPAARSLLVPALRAVYPDPEVQAETLRLVAVCDLAQAGRVAHIAPLSLGFRIEGEVS